MNKIFNFMRESSTARFFIPVGIMLIVFGVVMFVINKGNQDYLEVEATVTNATIFEEAYSDADGNIVEATYSVDLKYTVKERDYNARLEGVSKYNVGDKMKIYYNPKDPSQITQSKSLILPLVIIAAGIASLVGGIISAVNAIKKHKQMKEQERSWENA